MLRVQKVRLYPNEIIINIKNKIIRILYWLFVSHYRDDSTFLNRIQNISSRICQSYIFYFLIDYNSIVFYNILYFW